MSTWKDSIRFVKALADTPATIYGKAEGFQYHDNNSIADRIVVDSYASCTYTGYVAGSGNTEKREVIYNKDKWYFPHDKVAGNTGGWVYDVKVQSDGSLKYFKK